MPVGADGFRLPTVTEEATKPKIEVISGPHITETFQTFVIHNEDHTLGNALQHVLLHDPDVVFGGYVVPHPMEHRIHVRIQTVEGKSALQAFKKALTELRDQNLIVRRMLNEEITKYNQNQRRVNSSK